MLQTFEVLVVISMMAVVAILLNGLTTMVTHGEGAAVRSNQLMVARCLLQAVTLGLLVLAAAFIGH